MIERQRTGKGCYLEISLFATALHFMNYMAQAYWQTGKVPRKMGSAHGAIAPYQAFRTSDGNIMLGAGNDGQWQRLCQILGLAEAISDPRFATSASRVAHYSDTVALIQNQLLLKTSADWLEKFETAGLPCSIVNELDEALQHPQVEALGLVVETTHAKLGRVKQVAYPTSFAGSSRAENRTPPMLGEHSREILAEVGIAPDQIESLVRAGIVGQAP